jgi:hypothetical protein
MATLVHPELGRIFLPNPSISLPDGVTKPKFAGVVIATQRRPLWSIKGAIPALPSIERPWPSARQVVDSLLEPFRGLVDPNLFNTQVLWASVTHNERVNDGGGHNASRIFGTVGSANGVGNVVAVATTGFTAKTATDSSIGVDAGGQTTNEFTTIGLSRAVGTVQNYVAASTLNGTYATDIVKTFTASGGGTAHGSALFDSTTVAGSIMLCEDIFSSDAVLVSADTLAITWTWNG